MSLSGPNTNWPNLNWKEIEVLAREIAPELEGLFVDRIIVPGRPRFPQGYLKGEWIIRFTGRKQERALLISTRPRHPYFALYPDKGPQTAQAATRSPFDLALSKYLKEVKLLKLWTLPKERVLVLDFERQLRLALFLVPSSPEALLVHASSDPAWSVIARSRTIRDNPEMAAKFVVPDGSRAPSDLSIRDELGEGLLRPLESWLSEEAFALRLQALEKQIREGRKLAQERIRQSEVAQKEALGESDWNRYGNLLKGAIGTIPDAAAREYDVTDYESGEKVKIPGDLKLNLKGQIEKYYQNARRKQRRQSEAENRISLFNENLAKLNSAEKKLEKLKTGTPDWKSLEAIEREIGVSPSSEKEPSKKKGSGWLGRNFESRDKMAIWVGRNKDENLELTFKHARGNDLWMHVRGRPGAHVVIPLTSGKSAPLETLLDAANLAIYYSGGENWGKTEVDYTFKKYVKRIKDSTEASYTGNKTLIVEPDKARLKRLLGE